ncbi:MAG TPA: hypothetical protein P5145_05690, partial [Tenuifilaceae bacterium]|nr:hypothetical protein [Tenuifilaceae bacterium]
MNETTIYTLLKILASHAVNHGFDTHIDVFVDELLSENVSARFRNEFASYYQGQKSDSRKQQSVEVDVLDNDSLTKDTCIELRKTLTIEDRIMIVVKLFEMYEKFKNNPNFIDLPDLVANCLNVDPADTKFIKRFVALNEYDSIDPFRLVKLKGAPKLTETKNC